MIYLNKCRDINNNANNNDLYLYLTYIHKHLLPNRIQLLLLIDHHHLIIIQFFCWSYYKPIFSIIIIINHHHHFLLFFVTIVIIIIIKSVNNNNKVRKFVKLCNNINWIMLITIFIFHCTLIAFRHYIFVSFWKQTHKHQSINQLSQKYR